MSQLQIQAACSEVFLKAPAQKCAPPRFKLAPPYLREIPGEVVTNERDYLEKHFPVSTRLILHILWVLFRIQYYLGWRRAESSVKEIPHLNIAKSLLEVK